MQYEQKLVDIVSSFFGDIPLLLVLCALTFLSEACLRDLISLRLKPLFPSSERILEYMFKHHKSHMSRNFALKAPANGFHLTFLTFLNILKQGR